MGMLDNVKRDYAKATGIKKNAKQYVDECILQVFEMARVGAARPFRVHCPDRSVQESLIESLTAEGFKATTSDELGLTCEVDW